jgi:hypothetical protein
MTTRDAVETIEAHHAAALRLRDLATNDGELDAADDVMVDVMPGVDAANELEKAVAALNRLRREAREMERAVDALETKVIGEAVRLSGGERRAA